jgi:hypothetical protein
MYLRYDFMIHVFTLQLYDTCIHATIIRYMYLRYNYMIHVFMLRLYKHGVGVISMI